MDDETDSKTVTVKIPAKLPNVDSSQCHYLPCHIQHNGEASVSSYFQPKDNELDKDTLICSFRGRPLKGQRVKLPDTYEAMVLDRAETGETDRKVVKRFPGFNLWNWDQLPSAEDKAVRAVNDWIAISEAMHGT